MSMSQPMPGPDGHDVTAYRRSVRQIAAGDFLPDFRAHAIAPAVPDPDDGSHWLTLETGQDVRITTRKVWVVRTYAAPAWMAEALTAYRAARDARAAARESGAPAPAYAAAGTAGAGIAWNQLTDEEMAAVWPHPRLADFIREAAAAYRRPEEVTA